MSGLTGCHVVLEAVPLSGQSWNRAKGSGLSGSSCLAYAIPSVERAGFGTEGQLSLHAVWLAHASVSVY